MHRTLIPLLLAAALPLAAAEPTGPTYVLTPGVVSQYLFRGYRSGGPSLQTSFEADAGPLAAGLWVSTPLADKTPGQSDPEVDPYASYVFALSKDVSLVPGLQVYTYPRARTQDGFFKATVEPNLALNVTLGAMKVTPKFYYDLVLESPTAELNASTAIPLKGIGSELDLLATYGGYVARNWVNTADTSGPRTKAWGRYWLIGASLPFQLSAAGKLVVGWAYTRGFDSATKLGNEPKASNTLAVGRGVFSVAYAYTF